MLSEDELLVRRCQENDERAFDALFHRHLDRVHALVRHYTGDAEEARDLTQEVFVRVFAHIRSFRGECAFTTWLHRVTVNVCLEQRRKAGRRANYAAFVPMEEMDHELPGSEEGPVEALLRHDTQEKVRDAVASLPETYRIVVSLRYFQGLSCKEVAEVLQCPVGTVNSRLHYAMARLRERME